ncbi:hypothetical protein BDN67DRAFT_1071458 [Paxillus ammoniavirescens]|nr:hypothetical protein BDN67DRAFT_1071458 [Paxillus ammoniavirescens]
MALTLRPGGPVARPNADIESEKKIPVQLDFISVFWRSTISQELEPGEYVTSSVASATMGYRSRSVYRDVPVDKDAQNLRFEDEG